MSERILPGYSVYIPSKGRYDHPYTAQCLHEGGVPFFLVVEPQEVRMYRARFPQAEILVLPWSGDDQTRRDFCRERKIENGGLIAVRNWIKEHAIASGAIRHWQLDDNIRYFGRRYKARRIECEPGIALKVCEDLTDRYENVAISGLNYYMFVKDDFRILPLQVNCRVYSCSLILNAPPFRWRLAYNDDTDICLQALASGWCTLLLNTFLVQKIKTMVVSGGNTSDLYQGDGRLKMAKSLERVWPGVVTVDRRFHRPQHVVDWKRFDTPLQLKPGVDLRELPAIDEYTMSLAQVRDQIKSPRIQKLVTTWQQDHH